MGLAVAMSTRTAAGAIRFAAIAFILIEFARGRRIETAALLVALYLILGELMSLHATVRGDKP